MRIQMRNVTSLHQLLDDITSLARSQAGRESRQVEPLDATSVLESLCEGIRPLAKQRGLQLLTQGPPGLSIDGHAVKIRRIAQNLILNAVKYAREGSITVRWGDSRAYDPKRWGLNITDTDPGFHTDSGKPLAAPLDTQRTRGRRGDNDARRAKAASILGHLSVGGTETRSLSGEPGEGIGLSIVKRLCEMLDAKIEMESVRDQGTTFRLPFPRHYSS